MCGLRWLFANRNNSEGNSELAVWGAGRIWIWVIWFEFLVSFGRLTRVLVKLIRILEMKVK